MSAQYDLQSSQWRAVKSGTIASIEHSTSRRRTLRSPWIDSLKTGCKFYSILTKNLLVSMGSHVGAVVVTAVPLNVGLETIRVAEKHFDWALGRCFQVAKFLSCPIFAPNANWARAEV